MSNKGIKIVLSFSCDIFSYGVAQLLDDSPGITIHKILISGKTYSAEKFKAFTDSIILTDFPCLYNAMPAPESMESWPKIVLLDTNCGRDNITVAIIKKKLHGVINGNADKETLIKSIKMVSKGELWFDNDTIKGVLNGVNALKNNKINVLTVREREVVSLTGKGFRNKEMAQKLHISETTVKTHLYRIFQKLNIKTRAELIAFSLRFETPRISHINESMTQAQ